MISSLINSYYFIIFINSDFLVLLHFFGSEAKSQVPKKQMSLHDVQVTSEAAKTLRLDRESGSQIADAGSNL